MARQVTLKELEQIAIDSRVAVWERVEDYPRDPKIYLHWSAGKYGYVFDDYHINIKGDGSIWLTGPLSATKAHTYRRNTGAIGISLCCAYNATSNDLGAYAPTAKQIEVMAQCIAVVAHGLWLTIDKKHVLTHGEAADNEDGWYAHEPYGPKNGCERWDLEYLGTDESPRYNPYATDGSRGGDILRGKANWYSQQMYK